MGEKQEVEEKEAAAPEGENSEGSALEHGGGVQEGGQAAQESPPDEEAVPGVIGPSACSAEIAVGSTRGVKDGAEVWDGEQWVPETATEAMVRAETDAADVNRILAEQRNLLKIQEGRDPISQRATPAKPPPVGTRRPASLGQEEEWDGEHWVMISEAGQFPAAAEVAEAVKPPQGVPDPEITYYGVQFSPKCWLAKKHHEGGYCIARSPSQAFWTENSGYAAQMVQDYGGTLVTMTMTIFDDCGHLVVIV